MKTHVPTDAQEKAFKKVVDAMKEAKKKGLRFYGKSDVLVAYTKEASDYQNNDFKESSEGMFGSLPYLAGRNILSDSGADDYACYVTYEDYEKYNPDNF